MSFPSSLLPYLILALFSLSSSQTLTSTSSLIGASVNYTLSFSSSMQITQLDFSFSSWTDVTTAPFNTGTKLFIDGRQYIPVSFPGKLVCGLGGAVSVTVSTSIILTNMRNPASTRPLNMVVTSYNSSGSNSINVDLTKTQLLSRTFALVGYSNSVGASSTSVQFYLTPQYALLFSSTTLVLSYDPSLVTLSLSSTSSVYKIISQNSTSFTLGSFSTTSTTLLVLDGITVTNPRAAVSFTLTGTLFQVRNGSNYGIEQVSSTVNVVAAPFMGISGSGLLRYGVPGTVSVVGSCPFSQVSGPTSAYTLVTYNSSIVSPSSGSNCLNTSTANQCKISSIFSSPYPISSLLPLISTSTSTSLTLTSYTYLNGNFYALCTGSISFSITTQQLTSSIVGGCGSGVVGGSNNVSLRVVGSNVEVGDVISITGVKGNVTGTIWSRSVANGSTTYRHTIAASQLSGSTVTVALQYTNQGSTAPTTTLQSLTLTRSNMLYGTTPTPPSLCPIPTPLPISSSSLSSSSLTTYSTTTLQLQCVFGLFDYVQGDYLQVRVIGNGGEYLLNGGGYVGSGYGVSVNGVGAGNVDVINSTAVRVALSSSMLPSATSPTLKLTLTNIVNPAFTTTLSLSLTTYSSLTSTTKQHLPTSPTISITPSSLSTPSTSPSLSLYYLQNNSITITVTNSNRNIIALNTTNASSLLQIILPDNVTCDSVGMGKIAATQWSVGVGTNNGIFRGNTTQMRMELNNCYIGYLNNNTAITITQTINNVTSTSTTIIITNICGPTCYQCSSTTCLQCFPSSYTSLTLLYNNICTSSCPTNAYQLNSTTCASCHLSCATCTNSSLYTQCTSCAVNFINSSVINGCLSVCGQGQFVDTRGLCTKCHTNCKACISQSQCYICKTNATLIGNICYFTTCTSPCLTCQTNQSTCISCISNHYLYHNICYLTCPGGTYHNVNENGEGICMELKESSSYIPVSVVGVLAVLAVVAMRAWTGRKKSSSSGSSGDRKEGIRSTAYATNQEIINRPIQGEQQIRQTVAKKEVEVGNGSMNYKINVWRVAAVIFSYLQLTACLIILAKNNQYTLSLPSTPIIIVGLIFHLICNLVFLIGYCRIVRKGRILNTEQQQEHQQSEQPVRYTIVLALSVLVTFRTYKLLYSNLFVEREENHIKTMEREYPYEESAIKKNNPMGGKENQNKQKVIQSAIAPGRNSLALKQSHKINKTSQKGIYHSTGMFKKGGLINSSIVRGRQQPRAPQNSPSKKAIRMNDFGQDLPKSVSPGQPIQQVTYSPFKALNHPFLTYLSFLALVIPSLLLLIAAILQTSLSTFQNSLFWGIDALIVVTLSILLNSWDLWVFTNFSRKEQESEMSSNAARQQEVNYTHQNLRMAVEEEVQCQMDQNQNAFKKKRSPRKVTGSISNKIKQAPDTSSLKPQKQLQVQDNPPVLKVFDDMDGESDLTLPHENPMLNKTKKYYNKNVRYNSKHRPPRPPHLTSSHQINQNKGMHGQLCDDLYINFPSYELKKLQPDFSKKGKTHNDGSRTTFQYKSYKSQQSQKSGRQKSANDKSVEQIQAADDIMVQEFYQGDEPPNFEDISDIQEPAIKRGKGEDELEE